LQNKAYHRIHAIFIETTRIHVFCKHPCKLEIKSDGDISDGAFYRTSFQIALYRIFIFLQIVLPYAYTISVYFKVVK